MRELPMREQPMSEEDDKMFLDILNAVGEMDLTGEEEGDELIKRFAVIYKENVENKTFKADPFILEVVKDTIPEYYL